MDNPPEPRLALTDIIIVLSAFPVTSLAFYCFLRKDLRVDGLDTRMEGRQKDVAGFRANEPAPAMA